MRTRTWAPVATFVVVAGIGGAAALATSGGHATSGPRHLKLAGGDTAAVARSAGSANSDYVLDTTLPTDTPPDQRAYDLSKGPADEALVARLAKAMGEGTPQRAGDGWQAGGLQVSGKPGQMWTWSPCEGGAKDAAVGSDGTVSCAVASPPDAGSAPGAVSGSGSSGSSGSGTAVAPPAPSDAVEPSPGAKPSPAYTTPPDIPASTVREGTREVFAALGLDADDATVQTGPYGGDAVIDAPKLDGLTIYGMTNGVTVGQDGKANGGSGFLSTARAGDSYPVLSAKQAFDEMPALAHPDICQIPADGSPGCVQPEPTHITGAELGLSLQYTTDEGAVLVPSWLFQTKHGFIAAIAIEDQYRGSGAATPSVKPGTADDTPATANPTQVDPAPPARQPVAITGASRSADNPRAVRVSYDDGGCGHQNVTGQAKEDETTVYVFLEADPVAVGKLCARVGRTGTTTVELQAPLGDRKVVDASTNERVAVG